MIRVVREIVYEYPDDATADQDMALWHLKGKQLWGSNKTAESRVVSREQVTPNEQVTPKKRTNLVSERRGGLV